ncbi:MAG: threonine/homoserine/homoserine lactone efflux protein [Motiliproteus sp.]|jgi:threonine/homoserine/homoserine lactone efflux protein
MSLSIWFSLVIICVLGAMSPGPSLMMVLRHSLSNGRLHGILAALAHALGVAGWALLTIFGLALLVTEQPVLFRFFTYAGAGYLAWMGIKALQSKGRAPLEIDQVPAPLSEAVRDGALVALLNPKLAIFFVALFSQFVSAEMASTEQWITVLTVASIDGLWYIAVAVLLSNARMVKRLQQQSVLIDRISGLILVGLALRVVFL